MSERSLVAFDNWKTSQEKFDYFILGVIGALCAYLSQNIALQPLGVNSSTLELLALLVVLLSGIFGFLRIEYSVEAHGINHQQLHLSQKKGQLVTNYSGGLMVNTHTGEALTPKDARVEIRAIEQALPVIETQIIRLQSKTGTYYKLRNYCLLIGFLMIIGAKIYAAYEIS